MPYPNYGNAGPQGAANAELVESVPAYTTFVPGSSSDGWVCDAVVAGGNCRLSLGTLAGRSEGEATFSVRVDATVPAGVSVVSNTVRLVEGSGLEAMASDETPLEASALLIVTKTDDGAEVRPGQRIRYRIGCSNEGTQGVSSVELVETVPQHTSFIAEASSAWSCEGTGPGSRCVFPLGTLSASEAEEVEFVVLLDSDAPASFERVDNRVVLEATSGERAEATEETPIIRDGVQFLDLRVVKLSEVGAGEISYGIAYENLGTLPASGVVLVEQVPDGTTFNAEVSDAAWQCNEEGSCVLVVGDLVVSHNLS